MPTFALIAEGKTDQAVLEHIVHELCSGKFDGDVDVNPLQPPLDVTDMRLAPHAGWELVFRFCEGQLLGALEANDYVVIHIDTDDGDHPNFGFGLTINGKDKPFDVLINETIKILSTKFGAAIYDKISDRLLFAVAVHFIESWLLICRFGRDEPKASYDRLNRHLRRAGEPALAKDRDTYYNFCRQFKKRHLVKCADSENSFSFFIRRLIAL